MDRDELIYKTIQLATENVKNGGGARRRRKPDSMTALLKARSVFPMRSNVSPSPS